MELVSALGFELVQILSVAVIFPIVAPALGPGEYGRYTTLYVIAGLAMTWVSAAGGAAMVQLIIQRSRTVESVLLFARRQIYFAAIPFALLGSIASVALFGREILLPAVLVFGGDLVLGGIASVRINAIFATVGVTAASRIKMISPVLRMVGVTVLAATGEISIVSLVAINSGATLVVLMIAMKFSRDLGRYDDDAAEATSGRELLRLTGTYAATISANTTQDEGEKIVLVSYRPAAEVGEYQAAYRLISLALVPLEALNTVATRWALFPSDEPNAQLRRATRLSLVVGAYGVLVAIAAVIASPLIALILGEEFAQTTTMFLWLSGFPLFRALSDIPVIGLIGLNCNVERMVLGLSGAVAAVVLYLAMVPALGWQGAVIGTYISEMLTLLGGWILLIDRQRRVDRRRSVEGPDVPLPPPTVESRADSGGGYEPTTPPDTTL